MRLIDADAIPKEFLEYEFDGKWNGCTIKDLIDEQPTIQPEKAQLSKEGTTKDTTSDLPTVQPEPHGGLIDEFAKLCGQAEIPEWKEECEQLAEWLRELQERRKADSCEGCKSIGLWENEYENGVSCPCLRCSRRAKDNYEPERRTDD